MNRCTTHLTRLAVVALAADGVSLAQVVSPAEIKDPKLCGLQSKYQAELTAAVAAAHPYPAKSYLTRELDLRAGALFSADRRSIGFVTYGTQTVPRTTVSAGAGLAESVEFVFPLAELRRYENYDITGEQLINAGFVLINGERVGLDLQTAETVKP